MNLLKRYEKYCENYPHVKGLGNILAKFSPSENNHIYTILYIRDSGNGVFKL